VSRVNLLPSEIKKGQETRRRFILFLLAGVAIVLLVIAFWFVQSMRLGDVQSQIDAQNQTNASIQSQITGLQKYEQIQTEAQQQEQLLSSAYAGEVSYSGMLLDISKVIPVGHVSHELRVDVAGADGLDHDAEHLVIRHDHDVRRHDDVLGRDPALRLVERVADAP
jgi:Tfp pilus assembly protein PilN